MANSNVVLLVEGESDRAALETLAKRRDRDLKAEGVAIVAMGGSSPVGDFLESLSGTDVRLAGLCDQGEVGDFQRGLERVGFGVRLSIPEMESLGFFVCDVDLEDELIRSLGPDSVQAVIEREGEIRSFRSLQNQPAWRGRPVEDQLRRFFGSQSGRKLRYGRLLVGSLDLSQVPRPLDCVLAWTNRR